MKVPAPNCVLCENPHAETKGKRVVLSPTATALVIHEETPIWRSRYDKTNEPFFYEGDRLMVYLLPETDEDTEAYENNPRYQPA